MSGHKSKKGKVQINDLPEQALTPEQLNQVTGGRWKRNGVIPGYEPPTVLYDDGINILTTDPSTSNVVYDVPFTPIH
jgi:hypothetical protein